MGTNYYLHRDVCSHCGRSASEPLHIGKSSAGWCFSLQTYPDEGLRTLDDWKKLFNDPANRIVDEYGENRSSEYILNVITDRDMDRDFSKDPPPRGFATWSHFFAMNDAEPGPNGLLRHKIDGEFCIAHGEGTWDYMARDFS